MDLNKKLIDQLSDLSRNIRSLTSEVKENKNVVSAENANAQKESAKEDSGKKESTGDQNKNFLKSLEGIFKKGVGEITKSNVESKGILKDVVGAVKGKGLESALNAIAPLKNKGVQEITSNIKLPKEISGLLGKLPKFADGGTMKKDGLAVVGEKGPEVVKLDKGDKVVPNDRYEEILKMSLEERQKVDPAEYLKATKYGESKRKPEMKTVDQTLSPPSKKFLTEDSTLEEAKAKLLEIDPTYYAMFPEDLEPDAEYELKNLKEKRETFTQEDIKKLGTPVNTPITPPEEKKDPSKKEKRKESKKLKKEEDLLKKSQKKEGLKEKELKKEEDLLKKSQKKEGLKEKELKEEGEKEGEEKEGPTLMDKGKSFLKEKGVLDKGKNLLLSQGKNLLSGKNPMGDLLKDPSSLLGDKSQLLGKGIGAATSLLSNKGLREKGMEKIKGLTKKKEEEKNPASISKESPELKKPKVESKPSEESKKEEEKKEIQKKIEESKKEIKSTPPEKEPSKEEPKKPEVKSPGKESPGVQSSDLDDIKALLGKIAFLLQGPISIESMESPFRPDSRRF